jgi:hypothetical protein
MPEQWAIHLLLEDIEYISSHCHVARICFIWFPNNYHVLHKILFQKSLSLRSGYTHQSWQFGTLTVQNDCPTWLDEPTEHFGQIFHLHKICKNCHSYLSINSSKVAMVWFSGSPLQCKERNKNIKQTRSTLTTKMLLQLSKIQILEYMTIF